VCQSGSAIKVFAAENLQLLHSVDVPAVMETISWSPAGEQIAAGIGRYVHLYDRQLHLTRTLAGHSGIVLSLAWKPDGKTLVAGAADGATRIWNVDHSPNPIGTRTVCADLSGDDQESKTFFSSTGRFVAAFEQSSNELVVRELVNGTVLQKFAVDASDDVATVAWSGNDTWLAHPANGKRAIVLCNIANGDSRPLMTLSDGVIAELA
jgi:WD40 repeat protein